jgi:hypothetical protein
LATTTWVFLQILRVCRKSSPLSSAPIISTHTHTHTHYLFSWTNSLLLSWSTFTFYLFSFYFTLLLASPNNMCADEQLWGFFFKELTIDYRLGFS